GFQVEIHFLRACDIHLQTRGVRPAVLGWNRRPPRGRLERDLVASGEYLVLVLAVLDDTDVGVNAFLHPGEGHHDPVAGPAAQQPLALHLDEAKGLPAAAAAGNPKEHDEYEFTHGVSETSPG